jgi:hypothetical protein
MAYVTVEVFVRFCGAGDEPADGAGHQPVRTLTLVRGSSLGVHCHERSRARLLPMLADIPAHKATPVITQVCRYPPALARFPASVSSASL